MDSSSRLYITFTKRPGCRQSGKTSSATKKVPMSGHAVAVYKDGDSNNVLGHLPGEYLQDPLLFLDHDGSITVRVTTGDDTVVKEEEWRFNAS